MCVMFDYLAAYRFLVFEYLGLHIKQKGRVLTDIFREWRSRGEHVLP